MTTQAGVAEQLMVMLESSSAEVRAVACACLGDLAAAHPPLQPYLTQVALHILSTFRPCANFAHLPVFLALAREEHTAAMRTVQYFALAHDILQHHCYLRAALNV